MSKAFLKRSRQSMIVAKQVNVSLEQTMDKEKATQSKEEVVPVVKIIDSEKIHPSRVLARSNG